MRLPGGENVIIDDRKLGAYALSPVHAEGKHKARVFAAAFGLRAGDAGVLHRALRDAARDGDATVLTVDQYGARFRIRFPFQYGGKSGTINSSWIVPADGGRTRLITVFVD